MKSFKYVQLRYLGVLVMLAVVTAATPCRAISVSEEKELAGRFMEAIQSRGRMITDPICLGLVREIGNRIVAQLPPQPFEFSFHIMDSDQFNAFAAPGANIFVNRGLVTALDNADELAGILAHECTHAACRHVSQMIDKSKLVNMGTLIGVLAGVLVGVGGGGDGAQAVVMGSLAAGQTTMLAYSRDNEKEADQGGLGYLKAASFSPKGLLTSLEKIRANDFSGTDKIPGYLKTHPGSKERLVYIESWISDHGGDRAAQVDNGIDAFRFNMIRARFAGLFGDPEQTGAMFIKKLEKDTDNPVWHYGLALALARSSRLDEAVVHLKRGLVLRMDDPMFRLALGRVYLLQKEAEKAVPLLAGLEHIPGFAPQVLFVRGGAEMEMGRLDKAEKDFSDLLKIRGEAFPMVYFHLARVAGERGNPGESHYFLGLYYHAQKDGENAGFHLKKSLQKLTDPIKIKRAKVLLKKMKKTGKKTASRS